MHCSIGFTHQIMGVTCLSIIHVRITFFGYGLESGISETGGREASRTIQTLPHGRNDSAARYLRIASR
jgi:hypothetical protein